MSSKNNLNYFGKKKKIFLKNYKLIYHRLSVSPNVRKRSDVVIRWSVAVEDGDGNWNWNALARPNHVHITVSSPFALKLTIR
jgi:hypothetical protein